MTKQEKARKKVTLADLLDQKIQREKGSNKKWFDSQVLGGEIEVEKVPLRRIAAILDSDDEGMDMNSQLIYTCCPLFREKTLQEEYECHEPFEVVERVFDDNLGEIVCLVEFIMEMYGLNDVGSTIKN